jgi:hypothetical protein
MDQRILRPRTRIEYESKWSQLIEPKLGWIAVRESDDDGGSGLVRRSGFQ